MVIARGLKARTAAYLTTNSILMAAIGILVSQGLTFGYYISEILSVLGITLCLQMGIATARFRVQNLYLDRALRIMEKNPKWDQIPIFSELYDFVENQKAFPQVGDIPELKPNFAIKYHRRFWAPRMKGLPWLFGAIFIFLFFGELNKSFVRPCQLK